MTALRCPTCKSPIEPPRPADHPHFPFCSRECKLIDLGRWFDGAYRISEPLKDQDERPSEEPGAS